MALLRPTAHGRRLAALGAASWLCLAGTASGAQTLRPLADFTFSGYLQGRLTGRLLPPDPAPATLTDAGDGPGGQAFTQALLPRCEFSLGTALPWPGLRVQTAAALTGSKSQFTDYYLAWQPRADVTVKAGRFRVPFGIELQTSSGRLDFAERSLIYGFGNFGWAGPLGLGVLGERDYGLRADWTPPPGFAGFAPELAAAWVCGNGLNVATHAPTQVMGRLGAASRIALDEFRHEFALGVSGSYGHNRLTWRALRYLPIGAPGGWTGEPASAQTAADLGGRAEVSVVGADVRARLNGLTLQGETVLRRLGPHASHGYYVTVASENPLGDGRLTVAARWEEAVQGYADGAHEAGRLYRAATLGADWQPAPAWRAQVNYIAILLDDRWRAFPGSDLLITQVQFNF